MSPEAASAPLWACIAELGTSLHPARVEGIASSVEGLDSARDLDRARDSFGANEGALLFGKLKSAWERVPRVTPVEVASGLRCAAAAAALQRVRFGDVSLVWSGPFTGLIPVRETEQVAAEVIDAATERLLVVSFVAYNPEVLVACLKSALSRGVRVDILLEMGRDEGGRLDFDAAAQLAKRIPGARFLRWNPPADESGRRGAVHAKCIVADDRKAFITSANLTEAAMDHNMEVGLLVSGGPVPKQLADHFSALIETGVVSPV